MHEEQNVTFCGVKFSTLWLENAPAVNLGWVPEQAKCQLLPRKCKGHKSGWCWWRWMLGCYLYSQYYSLCLEEVFCKAKGNCYSATKPSHSISNILWMKLKLSLKKYYIFLLAGLRPLISRTYFCQKVDSTFSPLKKINLIFIKYAEKILIYSIILNIFTTSYEN